MTNSLLQRLHAAPSGSRALSDEVLLALGWTHTDKGQETWWSAPEPRLYDGAMCRPIYEDEARPHPSFSVDDALSLVPEGWVWTLEEDSAWLRCLADNDEGVAEYQGGLNGRGGKCTALALCIALIQAHEAKEKHVEEREAMLNNPEYLTRY